MNLKVSNFSHFGRPPFPTVKTRTEGPLCLKSFFQSSFLPSKSSESSFLPSKLSFLPSQISNKYCINPILLNKYFPKDIRSQKILGLQKIFGAPKIFGPKVPKYWVSKNIKSPSNICPQKIFRPNIFGFCNLWILTFFTSV